MSDLFQHNAGSGFAERAISPKRELGAYEALWSRQGMWFKSLAEIFREHPGCVPSDFVSDADCVKYARLALDAIRDAGIRHFGVRVHGAGEYPKRLRDAADPVELLYFQGLWDLVNTPCIAIVGTRNPTDDGKRRAAKLARLCVAEGYTVVSGLARGIDTVAHAAAIAENGFTIAVLGTPITECYPSENRELQSEIANRHLVISQVPIVRYASQHIRTRPHFFPERNATCFYVWEYAARRGYAAGPTNQLIKNLKIKPGEIAKTPGRQYYKQQAINHAARALRDLVGQHIAEGHFSFVPIPSRSTIVILDDVLNSGKHFKVAKSLLSMNHPAAAILGLFLTRCTHATDHDSP